MTDAETAASRLDTWDSRVQWLIVLAALTPPALALLELEPEGSVTLFVDLASWGVFAVDLVVRMVLSRGYLRTGTGLFDLSIVVFTFPWYVLPGVEGTQFLAVFRLARLVRVIAVTGAGRRLRYLSDQMGALLVVSVGILVYAALVVLRAEPPASGFESFGDALWWGVVTLTTVGYGDYFPVSSAGRFAGLLVMVLGLAVLGTLAGVLASVFGGAADAPDAAEPTDVTIGERLDRLDEQLRSVEGQLVALRSLLEADSGRETTE